MLFFPILISLLSPLYHWCSLAPQSGVRRDINLWGTLLTPHGGCKKKGLKIRDVERRGKNVTTTVYKQCNNQDLAWQCRKSQKLNT